MHKNNSLFDSEMASLLVSSAWKCSGSVLCRSSMVRTFFGKNTKDKHSFLGNKSIFRSLIMRVMH